MIDPIKSIYFSGVIITNSIVYWLIKLTIYKTVIVINFIVQRWFVQLTHTFTCKFVLTLTFLPNKNIIDKQN